MLDGPAFAVLQTLSVYGVNLFVLITGYFMVEKKTVSLRKLAGLLIDITFYGLAMYGVSLLVGIKQFSIGGLLKSALPLLAGYRWFVLAYCVLYLVAPLINVALGHVGKKQYLTFLVIYLFFFSLWPTFLPNPPLDDYGYSFHHLIVIYMIGGYIRHYGKDARVGWCSAVLAGSVLITAALHAVPDISFPILATAHGYRGANNSVFVIAGTVAIFLLFTKLHFSSKIVNLFAASAFSVFLIHGDFNTMDYLFNDLLQIGRTYDRSFWLVPYLLYIAAIYVGCALIDMGKKKLLDRPINRVLDYIGFLNYTISTQED